MYYLTNGWKMNTCVVIKMQMMVVGLTWSLEEGGGTIRYKRANCLLTIILKFYTIIFKWNKQIFWDTIFCKAYPVCPSQWITVLMQLNEAIVTWLNRQNTYWVNFKNRWPSLISLKNSSKTFCQSYHCVALQSALFWYCNKSSLLGGESIRSS